MLLVNLNNASQGFRTLVILILIQVLLDEHVAARLSDTKAAKETKALERFQELLLEDGDRAYYGTKQVRIVQSESSGIYRYRYAG